MNFRIHVEQAEFEGRRFPRLGGVLVQLGLDLVDDLFDARRVNASVGHQLLDRLLGDRAAERVEARQDDRAWGVVDNQFDARRLLQRANVAAFAADDSPLQIVAREVHHGDGGFNGVLRRAALNRLRDDLLRFFGRHFAGLGLQPLDEVGGISTRVLLDLFDDQLFGFVRRQPGDALQRIVMLAGECVTPCPIRCERAFQLGDGVLALAQLEVRLRGRPIMFGEFLRALCELPFNGGQFLAPRAGLPLCGL